MGRGSNIICRVWLAGLILCAIGSGISEAADPKRVLVLHSFGRDFKPWDEYARTIRTELERQSPWPLDIVDQSLVSARSGDDKAEQAFIDYLSTLYSTNALDLIVSIGAPAAAFVQRHRAGFFANTPMMFTAVEERRVQFTALTPIDTAVAARIDYRKSIENILRVLPDTRNVVMVIGASPIEKFWREEIGRQTEPFSGRLTFAWTNSLAFEDILKQAAVLPPNTAIFWELMIVDAAGVVHEGNTALERLGAVANAPIFSYDQSFFGTVLVGGPMLSARELSRKAAAVSVRILGGEKAGDIKLPPVPFAAPTFDWRQLQRWRISESSLPPGSKVQFRQPTVWEQFRWHIVAIVAAILLQGLLITWLIYEHRRRSAAEIQSRNAMAELTNMNRLATAGQLSASIAHEINQPVTGMVLKASAALRWLAAEKPDADKIRSLLNDIVSAGQRAGDIISSVRAMFKKDMNAKGTINLNNLINTVLALVRLDLQKDGIRVEMELDGQLPAVTGDPVQLQQVILNLVMNASDAMHTTQSRVLTVRSNRTASGAARVSIEDSGTGISKADLGRIFDPLFTTKSGGMGMGLSICRSIIENQHGKISVSATVGGGATFEFELPAAADAESGRPLAA
jgi:signal transduction histidine kinase